MKHQSIRTAFIIRIMAICLVCTAVFGAFQLYIEFQRDMKMLNDEVSLVETSTLPAIEASVWALDQVQTERLANSIFALPSIVLVRVEGSGVRTINLGSIATEEPSLSRTFELNHSLDKRNVKIGTLTVQASLSPLFEQLHFKLAMLAGLGLLQILVITAAAGVMMQNMVLQGLLAIKTRLRLLTPVQRAEQAEVSDFDFKYDELKDLQQELLAYQSSLQAKDLELSLQLSKFNSLSKNNPEIIWCCEFEKPIPTSLNIDDQTQRIFQYGVLTNLNTPAKQILIRSSSDSNLNLKTLPLVNDKLIRSLVQNKYRLKDATIEFQDPHSTTQYFRHSLNGWVEGEHLRAVWGIAIDVTQSLTTQKALEQREQQLYLSQTRLSEAQALAHMGHWSYYVESDKLQVSDEFARIYGFDPLHEHLRWSDLIKRIHPEDKSYVIHTLADPRTQAAGAEHRILWPNNETRFVQAIARKNIVDGKVDSTFGILIDITDRRRAEEERSKSQRALAESEARLAQAQAIAHMGHWLLDCSTKKLACSDEFYRLLGHAPQQRQLDQADFLEHIHTDDRALLEHVLVSAREKSFSNEFRILRRDGADRFMRGTFTPFYAGGKSSARIFGIMMDITEQKQAEFQLRASQELFATAFDSSPDGIFFIANHDGRFIKVNNALAKMLQSNEPHLLQQLFTDIPVARNSAQQTHIFDSMQTEHSATNVEIQITVAKVGQLNGLLSWQQVTIAQQPSILGIIHDVTPLRKLQKTADEQQKQLIQADKLASLGTMVAGVAHEVNNPNHLIQMNAELLEGFCGPILTSLDDLPAKHMKQIFNGISLKEIRETVPELLADIRVSSQRISRIVSDLKDFARPQENSEYLPTQLNQVVEKTLNLLSALIEKSHIPIQTKLAKNLPQVQGDSQRLEQVLVNLLVNAIEASKDDRPISVRTFYHAIDNSVNCEVEDQGCGISEESMQRIFDPFFTTKQDRGGTGLGLAISYRLIQEHGGSLSAKSRMDGGTVMSIKLPAAINVANSGHTQNQMRH